MQMQRMQMRTRLTFKHVTRYVQHLAGAYLELYQVSEMEPFAKTVNDLKPLETVIAKGSPWVFGRVLSTPLVFVKLYI